VLYFLLPFAIAISILGTRELWLSVVKPWQQRRNGHAAAAAVRPGAPVRQIAQQPRRQSKV
jgi:hypothetical protein